MLFQNTHSKSTVFSTIIIIIVFQWLLFGYRWCLGPTNNNNDLVWFDSFPMAMAFDVAVAKYPFRKQQKQQQLLFTKQSTKPFTTRIATTITTRTQLFSSRLSESGSSILTTTKDIENDTENKMQDYDTDTDIVGSEQFLQAQQQQQQPQQHAGIPYILQQLACGDSIVGYRQIPKEFCDDNTNYDLHSYSNSNDKNVLDDDVNNLICRQQQQQQHNVTVERVAISPPIFILRNFATHKECETIMKAVSSTDMQPAETVASVAAATATATFASGTNGSSSSTATAAAVTSTSNNNGNHQSTTTTTTTTTLDTQTNEARKKSFVSWLRMDQANGVVGRLAGAIRTMMLGGIGVRERSPSQLQSNNSGNGSLSFSLACEPMQVVRYDSGGEYILHHDGNHRILTVLYYINGEGETWFPLAQTTTTTNTNTNTKTTTTTTTSSSTTNTTNKVTTINSNDEQVPSRYTNNNYIPPPKTRQEALDMATKLQPGVDGVLVSTRKTVVHHEEQQQEQSSSFAFVNRGDAVAFYSYYDDGTMDWTALHAGMPAKNEKWIANHFIRYIPTTDSTTNQVR